MWCTVSCSRTPTSTPWWCQASALRCVPASFTRASTRCRVTNFVGSGITPCWPMSASSPRTASQPRACWKGRAVRRSERLALLHFWVAFGLFVPAVILGAWQMLRRSPLPAPVGDLGAYYASVTMHGTVMAYVLTTFFAMAFGYAVAATSLGRPIRGTAAAWIGFAICLIGTVMAAATVVSGHASVLYTFYPPLLASPWYYLGA